MALAATATTKAAPAMAATAMNRRQCRAQQRVIRCRAAAAAGGSVAAVTTAPAPVEEAARRVPGRMRSAAATVAGMWRQVQGCDDWAGLLEPGAVHPVLRAEVARYGDLVDACYKAFDLDPSSRRYLNCKYGRERMLAEVGLPGAGYEITRYVYAAPPDEVAVPTMEPASTSGRGRWIGYVAVSTDEMTRRLGRRDVLVSFREVLCTD